MREIPSARRIVDIVEPFAGSHFALSLKPERGARTTVRATCQYERGVHRVHEPLTFAEIARNGADVPEAVALVLAVAEECDPSADSPRWRAVPDAGHISLAANGRVTLAAEGDEIDEADHVKMLAALLNSLIVRDDREPAERPAHVPGALLLLIARATGSMDVPVPSFSAFRDALQRFGTTDRSPLGALFERCIAQRPDRRSRAPRPDDLRREIRELELELFATTPPRPQGRDRTRVAVAAVLATAALVASFMIGLHVIAPTHRARNPPDLGLARPPLSPSAAASPDPRSSAPPLATPARPQPASPASVSVTPVLTAATMGSDLFSPSFADHGHAILFHSGRAGSSLMHLSLDDAGKPSTILQDGAANFHAVRSPDGQWLAYDSDRDGTRAVYVARADGRDATKISRVGYAAVPRWSPEGGRVAFIRAEAGRPRVWNVWIADLGAHSLTRVSHHAVGQAWGASWFPDGTHLSYSVEDRLVIADLARGTRRVIASPIRGRLVRTPAVSPDGKWVVFQVHHDGAWLLQAATGRMQRVLSDPTAEEFAWSPDSRRVVYHTHRGGGWSLWQLAFDRKTFIS